MDTTALSTEDRISKAAQETFLKYGFHGTKLQQIAESAKVNKSVIHYYYRSKNKLYQIVVYQFIESLRTKKHKSHYEESSLRKEKWFLTTELYNNKTLLTQALEEYYGKAWKTQLCKAMETLDIQQVL